LYGKVIGELSKRRKRLVKGRREEKLQRKKWADFFLIPYIYEMNLPEKKTKGFKTEGGDDAEFDKESKKEGELSGETIEIQKVLL